VAPPRLSVDGLHKAYGDLPVLDGVSFTVDRGEFVAVVGPSGCGKSTLFDVVAGLEPPDGGRVLVDGVDVTGRTDAFAYMPQQDLLFPWRTVLDNEPFGALDALTRADMQVWLSTVRARFDWTVVLVTHDIREAVFLADRVAVLGPRPTSVRREVTVDLPRPRDLSTITAPAFAAAEAELLGSLVR
jgi:ABC-type nitrate/sulfonate/bicarbonate transport system ATPase subunit